MTEPLPNCFSICWTARLRADSRAGSRGGAASIVGVETDEAGADLWPHDERQIDVLRWFSWDAQHFTRHAGTLYFENLIKPAIGLGAPDAAAVELATCHFRTAAAVLDAHLAQNSYLVGAALTVADFATAAALPYAERIHLPLDEFPAIQRWRARLNELPAWREPFPH